MHVKLIGTFSKSIRQHNTGGAITRNNASLACMTMIEPDTGWFDIVEIPTCNIDEVTGGNNEYTDK